MPKSRMAYWQDKFNRNVERDREAMLKLKRLGWRPEIVWECETKNPDVLRDVLRRIFLDGRR